MATRKIIGTSIIAHLHAEFALAERYYDTGCKKLERWGFQKG